MADPYAERSDLPGEERIAAGSPLADAAREAGALVLGSLAEAGSAAGSEGPVVIVVADEGLVPPIARISPELAAALLCGPDASEDAAVAAARALLASGRPLYLLKSGPIAGPAGREGAHEPSPGAAIEALLAAEAGRIEWEQDPDFSYQVAAAIPGVSGLEADAFLPRLLYARADRVYEHAELVEVTKRRRRERLRVAGVDDQGLLASVGWPIEATGSEWKD